MKYLVLLLLAVSIKVNGQTAVAKIKYEQAEDAFVSNDFSKTLLKLEEAQKLLGSTNPKILYLRIMAFKGIISSGKYDFDILSKARKDAQFYIKQYAEAEGIEDKYREIFLFSENLDSLPKTKALYDQKVAEQLEQINEIKKRKAAIALVVDSLATIIGFKPGLTEADFLALHSGIEKKMSKSNYNGYIIYSRIYKKNFNMDPGAFSIAVKDNKVLTYHAFYRKENKEKTKLFYDQLKEWIMAVLPKELITESNIDKSITIQDKKFDEKYFAFFSFDATYSSISISVTIL